MEFTRREAIKLGAQAGAALLLAEGALAVPAQEAQLMRAIPSSGERIPAVGLGTANTFMQAARTPEEHAAIREVVKRFTERGGRFIDTCPCYGTSETVLGDLARDVGNVQNVLWATKISGARGRDAGLGQMRTSEQRLAPGKVFLNQVHNLGDWQVQLPLLRELKQEGRIKYVGITTTSDGDYNEVAQILRTEQLDFVQLDFAIDNRGVEETLFPIARDRGIATIAALPFGRARLFNRVAGRTLPDFAKEIDAATWAQFFLKYLLSNPDMTVVIPGTSNPNNLVDNMGAGLGRLPDAAMRRRMAAHIDQLPT
jgi:aryl-alcohol dehydrogenase-like predicted oxidoreductase